ncbi:MAG TPA: cache domain-containing protein [Usitatibacter sp.]|nr:cache domain-containing protein [Usitatibacter sp.]
MKKILALIATLVVSLAAHAADTDPGRASPQEAEAMVKKAIVYYKKNGKEKSMTEFMKNPGPFVDRDLYVTVYDMQANDLAHINPKMVGKNMMELRDADGKYHIKERMEAASKGTSGWQDFKFFNPVSKRIEPKRMYWEKYDNLVFACGAYKPE